MKEIKELEKIAKKLRFQVIRNSCDSKTPHLGSCLSCIDLLVALYWKILKINPDNPTDPNRDRLILSKGHAAPALFFTLAERGFFDKKKLEDYGKDGSIFGEHPSCTKISARYRSNNGFLRSWNAYGSWHGIIKATS